MSPLNDRHPDTPGEVAPTDDLELLRQSPYAHDRFQWHVTLCEECVDREARYCAIGEGLLQRAEAVYQARAAFVALDTTQRRLLLEDWTREAGLPSPAAGEG